MLKLMSDIWYVLYLCVFFCVLDLLLNLNFIS